MTTEPIPRQARHREQVAEEVDRVTVVAEAKLLVHQLDAYLQLMGEWIAEGVDDEDA